MRVRTKLWGYSLAAKLAKDRHGERRIEVSAYKGHNIVTNSIAFISLDQAMNTRKLSYNIEVGRIGVCAHSRADKLGPVSL